MNPYVDMYIQTYAAVIGSMAKPGNDHEYAMRQEDILYEAHAFALRACRDLQQAIPQLTAFQAEDRKADKERADRLSQ